MRVGRHSEAEAIFRSSLTAHQQALGVHHANALTVACNLASSLMNQLKHSAAETIYRSVLAQHRRADGVALHSYCTSGLAGALMNQKKCVRPPQSVRGLPRCLLVSSTGAAKPSSSTFADAAAPWRRHHFQLVARYDSQLSPTELNPRGRAPRLVCLQPGRHAQAEPLFRQTLAAQEHTLGQDHEHTLYTVYCLATALASLGRLAEAEGLARDVLSKQRRVLGENHPGTLKSAVRLADILLLAPHADTGDTAAAACESEALALYQDARARQAQALGAHHGDTHTTALKVLRLRARGNARRAQSAPAPTACYL